MKSGNIEAHFCEINSEIRNVGVKQNSKQQEVVQRHPR